MRNRALPTLVSSIVSAPRYSFQEGGNCDAFGEILDRLPDDVELSRRRIMAHGIVEESLPIAAAIAGDVVQSALNVLEKTRSSFTSAAASASVRRRGDAAAQMHRRFQAWWRRRESNCLCASPLSVGLFSFGQGRQIG